VRGVSEANYAALRRKSTLTPPLSQAWEREKSDLAVALRWVAACLSEALSRSCPAGPAHKKLIANSCPFRQALPTIPTQNRTHPFDCGYLLAVRQRCYPVPGGAYVLRELESMQISKKTRQQLDLLKLLVKKETAVRYKRTYLGFLWSLLNPLLTALVLFIAFNVFMRFQIENFALFLLAALFPWTWFASSVTISTNALTGNVSLIKKVIFPKHFLLLATIIAQLVNFVFSLPVLIVLVFFYGGVPSLNWLIGIPVLIMVQFVVIYGLALMISVANVYFRDLEYIVGVLISLLFWMTPIIYPLEAVPAEARVLLAMNPVTYLMQAWRDLFFSNTLNWQYILVSGITAAVVLLAGLLIFRKLERKLDEVL